MRGDCAVLCICRPFASYDNYFYHLATALRQTLSIDSAAPRSRICIRSPRLRHLRHAVQNRCSCRRCRGLCWLDRAVRRAPHGPGSARLRLSGACVLWQDWLADRRRPWPREHQGLVEPGAQGAGARHDGTPRLRTPTQLAPAEPASLCASLAIFHLSVTWRRSRPSMIATRTRTSSARSRSPATRARSSTSSPPSCAARRTSPSPPPPPMAPPSRPRAPSRCAFNSIPPPAVTLPRLPTPASPPIHSSITLAPAVTLTYMQTLRPPPRTLPLLAK